MNPNENQEVTTMDTVKAVVCVGSIAAGAVWGAYGLGKLGYDCVVEFRRSRKEKKTQTEN